ncbi:hypothetical protein Tco_0942099, partial [Tanacetum coccineum]
MPTIVAEARSRLGYLNAYGISQLKNGDTTASASNPLLAHYSAQ